MRFGRDTVCVVTGGLGFIGSHFVERALALGWTVHNVDKVTYASRSDTGFGGAKYHHIREDIAELASLPFCHAVVNFAAESHVDNSIESSMPFVKSNFLGVHRLLELIRLRMFANAQRSWNHNPPVFLQISTDEVFGDIVDGFFREDARFSPSNPYAATKAAAEMLVQAWARTYGLPVLLTRTTNNYGPHQHPEKLLPMAIKKCLTGEKVVVHGTGGYVRNWIHVLDNVDAIMAVLQEGEIGKAYHISSPEEFSVVDVVRKVLSQFGLPYDDTTIDTSSDRSGADLRYALDCSRIRALGWSAKRRFDDELPKIVEETRQVLVASGETTLRPVASGRKPRPRRTGGRRRGRRKGG
jgi:dTDP-glucose 4,6-dehydratase